MIFFPRRRPQRWALTLAAACVLPLAALLALPPSCSPLRRHLALAACAADLEHLRRECLAERCKLLDETFGFDGRQGKGPRAVRRRRLREGNAEIDDRYARLRREVRARHGLSPHDPPDSGAPGVWGVE
jgi:hypothetical protein